ncbi:MAG: Isomerizing Glutamine-fructose-6-phosphate aminotransferase [Candidatus Magasanikbacteria bacterium GW2011_GWC2_40_17]|uniref:Glutamine--fructose-6-phosphate aminotransferase [isomerizing] n=1 Tax=Candidatus Magasanikbacteria bacterium GW2011_GWA2_42_32 TaxID=1619039 RepID=A0A0G1A7V1_9BACT|nr:MAG: Isomerizing Glutamine-fructose-6-phosphate aminotransferase [Candidatus Magasanikbacteria bacterium GW2011_GWC2_40_17]KKS57117.1 MAG: Isomerizing Glutamine-fructose-6-phosphate aminotransferase [Candidatus Magasanikbacteria bacterium GW2011_GWA2_42_32]OGH85361.1 MAG: glutamine--fructose-6-phosphate aminotransferase [Candidatus Magasanikbacteria bacterium RIFOXYB2_FULL_38_10]
MCGIIGYIVKEGGAKNLAPILVNGLRRLEYRGYDSAGLAVVDSTSAALIEKSVGKIDALTEKLKSREFIGTLGIAHTRWATHGGVTENNTHPHSDCTGRIILVHNGIIENYRDLRENFLKDHRFISETDTEVLAHLIEHFYNQSEKKDLRASLIKALQMVVGTYGIAVVSLDEPNKIFCARQGSPLVLGVADEAYVIASDASPLLSYTKKVIYLEDGEILELTPEGFQIFNLKDEKIERTPEQIEWNEEQAQKGGFAHFMLKEIFDQPNTFKDALAGRLVPNDGVAHLGGMRFTDEEFRQIKKIKIIACGSAYHAGLIGKYVLEHVAWIPTDVEVASEFRYRDPVVEDNTLTICVSQSGETADTVAALREAQRKGSQVMGLVNVVGSTIAREAGRGVYIHAGPELSVASTKAFTNQIAILMVLALQLGRLTHLPLATGKLIIKNILEVPEKMQAILQQNDLIKSLAEKYKNFEDFYFIARGINYPIALEGALKLKEISYVHAEGLPAGELKHGSIALIDDNCPVVAIATRDSLYEKMISNIEEIKARRGKLILIATEGDEEIKKLAEDIIYVPKSSEMLSPLLTVLPLQLFAYHMAVSRGKDVDRPRNLAKSVTVE